MKLTDQEHPETTMHKNDPRPTSNRPASLTASAARPVVSQMGNRADVAARERAAQVARRLRLADAQGQSRSRY